jgi:hypothetical protein
MEHLVTIRTNRSQILRRINLVIRSNGRERNQVVNVNETRADFPVPLSKIEVAHETSGTEVHDASESCCGLPLIGVDDYSVLRAFGILSMDRYLLGETQSPISSARVSGRYLRHCVEQKRFDSIHIGLANEFNRNRVTLCPRISHASPGPSLQPYIACRPLKVLRITEIPSKPDGDGSRTMADVETVRSTTLGECAPGLLFQSADIRKAGTRGSENQVAKVSAS